jgi:hypothetical protein
MTASANEKDIPGFEGYTATRDGIIYSYKKGKKYKMKYRDSPDGYYRVSLCKDNKRYSKLVHRLIAASWIGEAKGMLVNHKDCDKHNNNISNLEYVSHKRNSQHAQENNLVHTKKRKVCKITPEGVLVAEYESISVAAKQEGVLVSRICGVCKGKERMLDGFVWKYKEDFIPGVGIRDVIRRTKMVEQYTKNGEFVNTYQSIKEASIAVEISASNIIATCTGKQPTAGGYKWRYAAETIVEKEEWSEWLEHENFPGYKISRDGRVYSTKHKKYMTVTPVSGGRIRYKLRSDTRAVAVFAHVLVAQVYIPNPLNYPIVNHIDGNPSNNKMENLEWCTYSENTLHAHRTGLTRTRRAVVKMTIDGKDIESYGSLKEAAISLGVTPPAISAACNGRSKTSHGFRWRYA